LSLFLLGAAVYLGSFLKARGEADAESFGADKHAASHQDDEVDHQKTNVPGESAIPGIAPDSPLQRAHDLYTDNKYKDAYELFSELAAGGNPIAMFYIGRFYRDGLFVDQDERQADNWFKKAFPLLSRQAQEGQVGAMYYLARMYRNGYATAEDWDAALEWYGKVVEASEYPKAIYRIGEIYLDKKDKEKARIWLQRAADAGDTDARQELEKL